MIIEYAIKFIDAHSAYETYAIRENFEDALSFARTRGVPFQIVRQRSSRNGFGAVVRPVVIAQSVLPQPKF